MKLIHKDLKKGTVKVRIENTDDLWYLSHIIEPKDSLRGKTFRKIKIGDDSSEDTKVVRKPVTLTIGIEKVQFSRNSALRASGTISEGPEDIPHGSYHTFTLEEGTEITIIKSSWMRFQVDKLEEASQGDKSSILLVIFDREEAHFALLKQFGYQYLSGLSGTVQKKGYEQEVKKPFFDEIIECLSEYDRRYQFNRIVIGSPAFWKETLLGRIKDEKLRRRLIKASVSSVHRKGFDELLRRDEVQQALQEERISKEVEEVEELLARIGKGSPATYGLRQVEQAAHSGAVELLLVSDALIWSSREEGYYERLDTIMRTVDRQKGRIIIVSHEHEGGQRLDGLGGIGALLRFKIE